MHSETWRLYGSLPGNDGIASTTSMMQPLGSGLFMLAWKDLTEPPPKVDNHAEGP